MTPRLSTGGGRTQVVGQGAHGLSHLLILVALHSELGAVGRS